MKKYDTVIIGAGNGGLACACMLAKHGQKVLLLEQSHIPGGFATSFKRGRFEFELSLHELCTFGRDENHSGAVRQLFDCLGISDKIEWVDIPEAFRLITSVQGSKFDAEMPFGIEEFCEKAEYYAPGCKKEMKRLFDLDEEIRITLQKLGKAKNKAAQLAVLLQKGGLLHTAAYSVDEVLEKINMPEKAKAIFKAYWAYLCTDFENLSFFHYLSMINAYVELKSVVPKSRSQEMSNCLADYFTSHSGELWLNSKVVKINTENNRCTSVVLNDGTVIEADNFVCNCSPHVAYGQLIEHEKIPEFEIKKANAQKFGGRGFCVFLGLNKSAEELGLKNYSYFIFPDMDSVKQFERMGKPETNDVQNTVCLNAAHPSASPEGTCMLCMTTLFTSDYWSSVTSENYFKEKERFAEHMIDVFEKATDINIKDHIEEIEIATPETFARFTGTPQGTIYGYLGQKWDGVMPRTMMANKKDGFDNLYFAGGYCERMLGFSSALASGRDCAARICRDAVINGRETL
ncbi:MAG: NAD(P)/FAD-dependent oxidoreductase [Clostridia bacterium]|nr:NAD(P)/FAD-dependent oxidoreductase [Clostridia bacterium]